MFSLLASFSIGLAGSLHCLGMCGPLVLAYSIHSRVEPQAGVAVLLGTAPGVLGNHLAFHGGRILTYAILGAIVAAILGGLEMQRFAMQYRGVTAILCGLLLVAFAVITLGILPLPSSLARLLIAPGVLLGKKAGGLAASKKPGARIALGMTAGLLPCGLSWAMLVKAASTLDPVKGFLLMAAFGLGTVPVLIAVGLSASVLSVKMRQFGEKVASLSIMVMGVLMVVKGANVFL